MRIALISTSVHGESGRNLASMTLAGRSLAHRQVDLALALGCERIACLAEAPGGEIVRIQHAAERAGAKFHTISGPRALAALVKAADEILVMAPGVLTSARLLRDALGDRPGILTLPAERAVPAGFERIDSEAAWGGFLIVHGSAAERLTDLPPDGDPVSGLLRVALQQGVRRVVLAPASLDAGDLGLVTDAQTLAKAERRWLRTSGGSEGWRRPGAALTSSLARFAAHRALARRRMPLFADVTGIVLSAGAAALALLERPAACLSVLVLSAMAFIAARTWRGIERGEAQEPGAKGWRLGDVIVDAVMLASVVAAVPRFPGFAAFSAIVLVLAMRMAGTADQRSYAAPAGDRVLVLAVLALAAAFGKLLPAVQALAIVALALNLLTQARPRG